MVVCFKHYSSMTQVVEVVKKKTSPQDRGEAHYDYEQQPRTLALMKDVPILD